MENSVRVSRTPGFEHRLKIDLGLVLEIGENSIQTVPIAKFSCAVTNQMFVDKLLALVVERSFLEPKGENTCLFSVRMI